MIMCHNPGQREFVNINPLTAGAKFIRVFTQLLPHSERPFRHAKAIMLHQSA